MPAQRGALPRTDSRTSRISVLMDPPTACSLLRMLVRVLRRQPTCPSTCPSTCGPLPPRAHRCALLQAALPSGPARERRQLRPLGGRSRRPFVTSRLADGEARARACTSCCIRSATCASTHVSSRTRTRAGTRARTASRARSRVAAHQVAGSLCACGGVSRGARGGVSARWRSASSTSHWARHSDSGADHCCPSGICRPIVR